MTQHFKPPSDANERTRLKFALALAKRGMYIAPLMSESKLPFADESWSRMRTRDPNQIAAWFKERPGMNYAVIPGENYVVLDLDTKKGKDGVGDLNALAQEAGDFNGSHEATLAISTPSGGLHLYYKAPWPVSVAHMLPRSIDVRGNDGYVVGPGCETVHNTMTNTLDGSYEIKNKADIMPLPEWVVPRLNQWMPREDRPHYEDSVEEIDGKLYVDGVQLDQPDRVTRAIEWLKEGAKPAIEYEGGNQTTYNTFAWLREHAISVPLSLELVAKYYNPRCQTKDGQPSPWTYEELERIRDNAYKYAKRQVSEAGGLLDRGLTEAEIVATSQNIDSGLVLSHAPSKSDARTPQRVRFAPRSEADQDSRPEPQWVIEGLIQEQAQAIIYAPEDSYKSFVGVEIGLSLASGLRTFGRFNVNKPGPVLYIAGEGAPGIEKLRRPGWRAARNVPPSKVLPFYTLDDMPDFADETERDPELMIQQIDSLGIKFGAFIVDTVARAMAGHDENSAKDFGRFVRTCDALRAHYGSIVIGIHHSGHNGKLRGSTAFPAGFDTRFRIESNKDKLTVRIKNEKQKDGAPVAGFINLQGRELVVPGSKRTTLIFDPMPDDVATELFKARPLAFETEVSRALYFLRVAAGLPVKVGTPVLATEIVELAYRDAEKAGQPLSENERANRKSKMMERLQRHARSGFKLKPKAGDPSPLPGQLAAFLGCDLDDRELTWDTAKGSPTAADLADEIKED